MTRQKAKQDIVISVFFYALVGFVFYLTANLEEADSRIFPQVILALTTFLTTLLFVRALKALLKAPAEQRGNKPWTGFNRELWLPYLAFAGIVIYILLFESMNYFIASAALILVFLLVCKVRPLWLIAAVTGGYLLFTYVLFVQLLKVKLI